MTIRVELAANSADLPWKQFPDEATGSGRLFAAVASAGAPTSAKFQDDVNLKTGFAPLALQVCATPGDLSAFCFLDDRGDSQVAEADSLLRISDDYLDTCPAQRAIPVTVLRGKASTVTCQLTESCD